MNTLQEYIYAAAMFVGMILILKLFSMVLISRFKHLTKKTKTWIDDWLSDILDLHWPFYVLVALYMGLRMIEVPKLLDQIVYYLLLFSVAYYIINALQKLVDHSTKQYVAKKEGDKSVVHVMSILIKITLWIIAILFVMSNLGINVNSFIAGLGIGGIAIAFALQNVLADIFASFSIYFDKPFKVGHFIIIGKDMGVVQKIGIKSTRIKTLEGQELIVSNKELTEIRVNNYKKMERRRIVFRFGVTYQTTTVQVKKALKIVKDTIDKIKLAELDRVHFKEFGDSALRFEVVYYVDTPEYLDYMNIQQEINLAIMQGFEKAKIEMAYPTQTVYVKK